MNPFSSHDSSAGSGQKDSIPHTLMANVAGVAGTYVPKTSQRDQYSDYYTEEHFDGTAPPWFRTDEEDVNTKVTSYGEAVGLASTFAKGVVYFFRPHTALMVLVTILATLFCSPALLNVAFDTSFSIFAFGTVFPLTFAMKANFDNRERALAALAKLKATVFALMVTVQTWDTKAAQRGGAGAAPGEGLRPLCVDLLAHIEHYCRLDVKDCMESASDPKSSDNAVYDDIAKIGALLEKSAPEFGYSGSKGGEGGNSRLWMFVHDIAADWEEIKSVRLYRSPKGLKRFCYLLIHMAPIALAPYWGHYCEKEHDGHAASKLGLVQSAYGCTSGYLVGSLYAAILTAMYRVLDDLEDPFDGEGDDDINWDAWSQQNDNIGRFGPGGVKLRERKKLFSRQVSEQEK